MQSFPTCTIEEVGVEEDAFEDGWAHGDETFVFAVEDDDGFVGSLREIDEVFRLREFVEIAGLHDAPLSVGLTLWGNFTEFCERVFVRKALR